MKTKKFTYGMILFLFAFFANFTISHAQVTVYDDFNIPDGPLTNGIGSSGSGWSDTWTYDTKTSGVTVNNGAFESTDGGFGLTRYLTTPIPLGTSTFYLSFVVKKSATGEFRFAGLRADGIERYAVGVKANGALFGNIAMNGTTVQSDAGIIEDETTYIVVAKWWYEGSKGHMNIVSYKGGESIPTEEPATGGWDFEKTGGTTGVIVDKIRISYSAGNVNLYDLKLSNTWASATESPVIIAPSDIVVKATSNTEATLKWSDNAFNEEGTRIYLNGTVLGTVGANTAQYDLTGLTNLNQYTVGVAAFKGTEVSKTTELTFTFELDETAPTVVEVSPSNNAINVDETSDILITFSEAMNKTSVEGAITVLPALTNAVYTWIDETKLSITAGDLTNEAQYTVTIGNTAKDISGNAMVPFVTGFTVAIKDIIPPAITKIVPANNATDILVTSSIIISFSEAMDKTSVEGAISVVPLIANMAFKWNDNSTVVVSGSGMTKATAYTVTIGSGAKDIKGNAMVADELVTFTTSSSTLQAYDDFNIGDGNLTNSNGSSGAGWNGPWSYIKGEGGVVALNNYLSGGSKVILKRKFNFPLIIGDKDFYISFLAVRSPEGAFRVVGGREFSGAYQWRTGVGVSEDGSLGVVNNAGAYLSSGNSDVFEAGTTYLVVLKQIHRVSQQIKIFKMGDAITEPGVGEWDYEIVQGSTGVAMDYIGIDFISAGVNIDELKMGTSWNDVSNTTITDISATPLIAPANLVVTANSATSAELEWSDNSVVEEGFKIYKNGTELVSLGENVTYYKLSDLTDGESYNISVSAFRGVEEAVSSEISYTFTFDAENYVDTKIDIAKSPVAPVIDGIVDNVWADAFKNPVKRINILGDLAPINAADYKCTWSAMWDNNKLYFLFEVTDATLVFNDGSGTNIGQADGFDMPMAAGPNGAWTMNRLNVVTPAGAPAAVYIHEGMAAYKNAEKAFALTDTGYNIELSMVLRDFDQNIGLVVEGYQFRIDVRYNDNDNNTSVNRDGQYTWTNKNDIGWTWNNINSLGYVTLVPTIDHTAVGTPQASKILISVSENGSFLNILNYEGMVDIYSISGTMVKRVMNSSEAINIEKLNKGIYIVKTEAGAVKFVK